MTEYRLHKPENGMLFASRGEDVYIVLVDDDIAAELAGKRLSVNKKGYVVLPRKWRGHYMLHTAVLGAKEGLVIDHINNDKLDNRRQNLQHITNAENCRKRPRHKPNKTGYRGVTQLQGGKYQASIMVDYKRTYLGSFDTAEEAARVYDAAVRKHHGSFGCLNFPVCHEIKAEAS